MAVFHYCANTRHPCGRIETSDGVFEAREPGLDGAWLDGAWLDELRAGIASRFNPPEDPSRVQITLLTRIGG